MANSLGNQQTSQITRTEKECNPVHFPDIEERVSGNGTLLRRMHAFPVPRTAAHLSPLCLLIPLVTDIFRFTRYARYKDEIENLLVVEDADMV